MPLRSVADVNVLLPLLLPRHPAHAAARDWLEQQESGSVAWCVQSQLGVLRLLCNAKLMGAAVLTPSAALNVWQALVAADAFTPQLETPEAHAGLLARLVQKRAATPNVWTDAWLATLALSLDCEMVTFDQGFRAFAGLKLRLLTTPSA